MSEAHETVIVGQAGLALSYCLSKLGREHVILERGRVAERLRSERWDSLAFQFPSWRIRLPGCAYRGGNPDGFASRDEVVRFIERCAKQEPGPRGAMSENRFYAIYARVGKIAWARRPLPGGLTVG